MPVRRAKLFGQLHRFGQRHPVRQLRVRLQFVQAKPQYRVLDGIEFRRCNFAQAGQAQIQRLAIRSDGFDQAAKVIHIDALRLRILRELRQNILPGKRIDLDLIKSLQGQPARQTAGPMGRRP
jgi:hypothetical protein